MSENFLTSPQIWVEHIPAHKFIGLYDLNAKGYWDFEKRPDFDEIEGILESFIPVSYTHLTDAKQVPSLTKNAVVCPVSCPCTDRSNRNKVHNKHDYNKDKMCIRDRTWALQSTL